MSACAQLMIRPRGCKTFRGEVWLGVFTDRHRHRHRHTHTHTHTQGVKPGSFSLCSPRGGIPSSLVCSASKIQARAVGWLQPSHLSSATVSLCGGRYCSRRNRLRSHLPGAQMLTLFPGDDELMACPQSCVVFPSSPGNGWSRSRIVCCLAIA